MHFHRFSFIRLRRFLVAGLALASILLLTGFLKEARMQVPAELAGIERWPVSGRQGWKKNQKLAFGEVRVDDVKRSITKGGDLQILFYGGSKRRQKFSFATAEADGALWRGEAEATLKKRRLGVGLDLDVEMRNKSGLKAWFTSQADRREVWKLELRETRERPYAGTLAYGDTVLEVIGLTQLEGTPVPLGDTAGYRIDFDGRPVAAAEVINDGAVWISPDIDPAHRGAVNATLAALLLFEELRHTLPD